MIQVLNSPKVLLPSCAIIVHDIDQLRYIAILSEDGLESDFNNQTSRTVESDVKAGSPIQSLSCPVAYIQDNQAALVTTFTKFVLRMILDALYFTQIQPSGHKVFQRVRGMNHGLGTITVQITCRGSYTALTVKVFSKSSIGNINVD